MCRRNSIEMKVFPVMCTVNMQQGDKEKEQRERRERGEREERERQLSRLDYQT